MGKKKGGKKANWKSVPVDAVIDANVKKTNWADEVEKEEENSDHISQKPVVLPTAPRASRASDFDETKIPLNPPFLIHVSNIPYELEDEELAAFFEGLDIKMVRLPKDDGKRAKGYGYVEFNSRADLIAALNKPDTIIKNRPIKIELSTAESRGGMNRGGPRGNRDGGMRSDMGGPDRTASNWRSGPRDEFEDRSGGFDRGGGGRPYGGDGRRDFSGGSGGGFRSGFDRDDRGFREDRGGGFRDDRDRGGFENRDRDRGFQRDDRRDFSDRGFREDRGDRGGFRDNRDRGGFRDRGFDEERRDDRSGGGGITGGSWREDRPAPPRENFSDRGDRGFDRRDDRRRDDREPPARFERAPRRDDLPPPERAPVERKKLNLQPRSANPAPEASKQPAPVASSAIFGGAKPVDTTAREREVEERLAKGEDFSSDRSGGNRSGPGSTSGGSTKDHQESERERDAAVEPAPPPKENAWHRKPTSPVVNNGRTTPEGPSGDERGDGQRSWGRDREGPRKQEPRRTDDQRSSRPPPKSGPPSGPDKGRPREDRPPHKSRERRNIDDVSKMPKMVENKAPSTTMTTTLKVFTMNVWGIPYISKEKALRISALAEALETKDYDVICLQEVWDIDDFDLIGKTLKEKLPHKYYFYSGLLGSGLCVFSRWPIVRTFYYKFPLNGYIHKVHHGDWLAGKGVALAQIDVKNKIVNVFNTHLHAEYCVENDEYLCHRLSQAYEAGQLIRLSEESGALTILAGDLNSKPSDVCLQLLCSLAGLKDSFLHQEVEWEYGTNESSRNTFSPAAVLSKNPQGHRLDYILFTSNSSHSAESLSYGFALANRIPGTNLSYSDHEAVEATIRFHETPSSSPSKTDPRKNPEFAQLIRNSYLICENGIRQVNYKSRWIKVIALLTTVFLALIFIIQMDHDHHLSSFKWFLLYFLPISTLAVSAVFWILYRIEFRSLCAIQNSLRLLV